MTGIVRWLLALAVCLAAVIVGLVIYVSLVFNPNYYTANVIQMVKAHTGLELRLKNEPSWRLLPWPRVSISGAELFLPGNHAQPGPLVELGDVVINARLLPLLRGRIVANDILVKAPRVQFYQGVGQQPGWSQWINWLKQGHHQPARKGLEKVLVFNQARLDITDGMLHYQRSHPPGSHGPAPITLELSHIDAHSQTLGTSQFIPASISMNVRSSLGYAGHVRVAGEVNVVPHCHLYALRKVQLQSCGKVPAISHDREQRLNVLMNNLNMNVPDGSYQAGDVLVQGVIASDTLRHQALAYTGRMDLAADTNDRTAVAKRVRIEASHQLSIKGMFKLEHSVNRSCYNASIGMPKGGIHQWLKESGIDINNWPQITKLVLKAVDKASISQVGNHTVLINQCGTR